AGNAFFAPKAKRWVTVLTMPVRDDAGQAQGLVALPLDLIMLNQQIMKDVPEGLLVTVLDRQSQIILRSAELRSFLGRSVAEQLASVRDAVESNRVGVFELQDQTGVNRVFAYRRMPTTGWLVFAGLPRDEVFAAADTALQRSVLASIALLALALALAWRLSRRIVQPLEAMAATSSRIAAGDVSARVTTDDAPPDVAELGNAFNQMLQARQVAEAALRENEENLSITLQSIGDAVIATDLGGRVIRMNPAAERLTGWPREQANGLPLAQVFRISDVDGGVAQDPVEQVLRTGEVVGLSNGTELESRDGTRYHIADSAA
ncbi:MAG: PAS domain-containing protein, partial [Rhodoferax sp.]|nr:PAS domain-containing protein [Rhodoferax sp.]